MIFAIQEKSLVLTHAIYCLAIATNIHQRLQTKGFVVQGHNYILKYMNKFHICNNISQYYSFYFIFI